MKKHTMLTVLSAAFLFSTQLSFTQDNYYNYCRDNNYDVYCDYKYPGSIASPGYWDDVYSANGIYRAHLEYVYGDNLLCITKDYKTEHLYEFKNVKSFCFSKDNTYLMVERFEYVQDAEGKHDFIEIFNLKNKKRVLFMPFVKPCFPSKRYYKSKAYNVDDLVTLEFSGDTLESVEWNFEDALVTIPAMLDNVYSVYVSAYSPAISVCFTGGTLKIYMPKKDFSGLYETFVFEGPHCTQDSCSFCLEDDCC